ncbi:MAG: hypothetical protein AB8I08_25265 [Sandaracinaceae bacterium]
MKPAYLRFLLSALVWLGTAGTAFAFGAPDPQWGTNSPTVLLGVDPGGRWLAMCQARTDTNGDGQVSVSAGIHGSLSGDRLVPYLMMGPGEGQPIQRFVGADASGDRLVIVSGETQWLVQADGTRTSLGPAPPTLPRTAFRDGAVLFVRGPGRVPILRTAEGAERELRVPGPVMALGFHPHAGYVELLVLDRDTDGDGQRTAPVLRTTAAPENACSPGTLSSSSYGYEGDRPRVYLFRTEDGWSHPVEEALPEGAPIAPLGDRLLLRRSDGALVLAGRGTPEVWMEAACQPVVLAVHPEGRRALVRCVRDEEASVWLVTDGHPRRLPVEEGSVSSRERPSYGPLFFARDHIVDIERGRVLPLPEHDRIVALEGRHLLYLHRRRVFFRDLERARPAVIGRSRPGWWPTTRAGYSHMGPLTFDLRRGRRVGRGEPDAVGFGVRGRRLLAAEGGRISTGPFRWVDPVDRPLPPRRPRPSTRAAAPPGPVLQGTSCVLSARDDVELEVIPADRTRMRPGQRLSVNAYVRNEGRRPVQISLDEEPRWDQLRTSPMTVEGGDGEAAPLGWAPDQARFRDRELRTILVPPGSRTSLGLFTIPVRHSARNGRVELRLRVRPVAPCDHPYELVSNTIVATVSGARAGATECRDRQRAELLALPAIRSEPIAMFMRDRADANRGAWAVVERHMLGPGTDLAAELWLLRLDGTWQPDAPALRLLAMQQDMTGVRAVATPGGMLLASVPNHDGDVVVQSVSLGPDEATVQRVTRLPGSRRGVTDIADFRVRGDRAVLLHTGGIDAVARLWRLDVAGRATGPAIDLRGRGRRWGDASVGLDAAGTAWVLHEDFSSALALLRVDSNGTLAPRVRVPIAGQPTRIDVHDGVVSVLYVDNQSGHRGPLDRMGLAIVSYDIGAGALGAPHQLVDPGDDPAVGGVLEVRRHRFAAVMPYRGGANPVTAIAGEERTEVGTSLTAPRVFPFGDGVAVLFSDPRHDTSPGCTGRSQCVGEAYAAWARPGRGAESIRLTEDATRMPVTGDDWEPQVVCPGRP